MSKRCEACPESSCDCVVVDGRVRALSRSIKRTEYDSSRLCTSTISDFSNKVAFEIEVANLALKLESKWPVVKDSVIDEIYADLHILDINSLTNAIVNHTVSHLTFVLIQFYESQSGLAILRAT